MHHGLQLATTAASSTSDVARIESPSTTDWRVELPMLMGARCRLRELRRSDATMLMTVMNDPNVSRFISPPPATTDSFERFIAWGQQQRANGQYVCFALTPLGADEAIGLFQLRALEPTFGVAEWGFALSPDYWGGGLFMDAAQQVLRFAFETIGVHRLEARSAVVNARGNGALRKLGAVPEGVLRRSMLRDGVLLDQMLWTILSDEWIPAIQPRARVH